jgi:hypothetical protein
MSTLTVFLAPDGPAAGVRDVLTDLSAAGLVADFLWVVDADVELDEYGGAPDVPAELVAHGTTTATTARRALSDIDHDRRRLCVVVPVADGAAVSSAVEQRLSGIVAFADSRGVPTTRIRVVVARRGDHTSHEVLSRNGWHNVYLAPEDARGPGLPALLLGRDTDTVELGRHAAPAIAGLVGLWTGVDRTPLDEPQAPDGVRAARAFYRRIDAGMVEADLRARVLSTRPLLPKPTDHAGHTEYAPDPVGACRDMAGVWWSRHRAALIGPRQTPRTPPAPPIGWWALVRMFFAFVWSALRNVPADLFHGTVARSATFAARQVHQLVLGSDDAAYTVVVHGRDRNGMPVDWRALGAAANRLDSTLATAGLIGQQERPDLRHMWIEFADGAMTLADAGKRSLPRIPMGSAWGVLRSTADIAPPPRADFVEIPGQLHTDVGERVAVGDALGTEVLRGRLQFFLGDHMRAGDASRTLEHLGAWQNAHRTSYAVQVGGILATSLFGVLDEIRGHLAWLRDAAGQAGPGTSGPGRARVWLTRILALLAVAGVVSAPILFLGGVVAWRAALVIGLLPLVVWLIFVITGYVRERREIFRDLNRRQELVSKLEAVRANLRQATIDAGRLTEAYEQYLVWNRVVGALLDEPFGRAGTGPALGDEITYGLPRTTRIARAQVREEATGDAAETLRADVFRTGWMGDVWRDHLHGAGRELNSAELHRHPDVLHDLRGGVPGSYLQRWADLLDRRGPSAAPGDRRWAQVHESLRRSHRRLGEGLLSSVREIGPGAQPTVDLDAFLCGVNRTAQETRGQEFAAEHFTATGRAGSRGRVAVHEAMQAPLGLSRVDVLVQLTEACEPWAFAVTEGPPAQPTPGGFVPPAGYSHAEHGPPAEEAAGEPTVVPDAPTGFL